MRTRANENDEHLSYLEHARSEMDALAAHPTAERLYAYVDAVWPDLNDTEIKAFELALRNIEDGVLEHEHVTLRWSLMFEQFKFGSSPIPDSGIAPYMPGTLDIGEAAGYGRAGVLVLDLPLTAFEIPNRDRRGEVSIKGALRPEHIMGVFVQEPGRWLEHEERGADLMRAVERVLPPSASIETEDALLKAKEVDTRQSDDMQREHDIAVIRDRRAKLVRTKFADLGVTEDESRRLAVKWNTDVYTATKQALYDVLERRYIATNQSAYGLLYATYENEYRESVPFDREAVTDEMLIGLQRTVRTYEQYRRDQDEYTVKRAALTKRMDSL